MSENSVQQIEDQLSEVMGLEDDAELGELAKAFTELKGLRSKADKEYDRLKKAIINKLDSLGLESAKAGGRNLGFTTRKFYGIAEGDGPHEHDENVRRLKDWLEQVAPEVNVPASANIGKAVQAFLDQNPEAEIPDFVAVTERRTLTNRQA